MMDIYGRYLRGVGDLLRSIEPADEDHLIVLTLQGRLASAISDIRQVGPTNDARAEVTRVITELDRISLRVLRQSFQSLCGIPEAPPAEPLILHNLPSRTFFVGRQRELRLLHEYLSPEERVGLISIDGIGGIGKTALAREAAHHLVEGRAFQAVVWTTAKRRSLGARGIIEERPDFTSLDELLAIIATVLGGSSSGIKDTVVKRMLAESRSLVIVDNFEAVGDDRVFQFLRKIPSQSKALITNRHRPASEIRSGELVLPLKGMEKEDAFQLLRRAGQTIPPPLADADQSLLEVIYERAHGVPLAMEWFVAQVGRGQPAQRVLQRLGQPKANDLYRFIFEDSYSSLGNEAKRALWAMAVIDSPTVADQICYVAELAPGEFERAVDELIETSLVTFDPGSALYTVLDITREYILALINQEREKLARRAIDWETRARYERLDDMAKEAMRLLARADRPVPVPTLARLLGGIGSSILDNLLASLEEAGLVVYDKALQMIALRPQIREAWQSPLTGLRVTAQESTIVTVEHNIVILGDVHGSVIGDDAVVVSASLAKYLSYLIESRSRLRLLAFDPNITDVPSLRLPDMFITLFAAQRRPRVGEERQGVAALPTDETPVSLLKAVSNTRRTVVLGGPGSGKTTFLNYLVWASASRRLGTDVEAFPKELDGLPLPVLARDYADLLSQEPETPFIEFLLRNLASLGFADLIDYFKQQLAAGGCLIPIDGLDEVAKIQRMQVVTRIEDFALQYPQNRVIITSRSASLQGIPLFPAEWVAIEIAPFVDEQIDSFIAAWYRSLIQTGFIDAQRAEVMASRLTDAVKKNRQLRTLATSPLLLTVIAALHTSTGTVPENRVALYQNAADLLIWRWEASKAPPSFGELGSTLRLTVTDLHEVLAEIAFRIQLSGDATIDGGSLFRVTASRFSGSDWNKATQLLEYLRERADLLVEPVHPDRREYRFVHSAFQEYYAARYLAEQEEYPRLGLDLLRTDFNRWQEVYLLSVLYLEMVGQATRAIGAIRALCPSEWKSEVDLRLAIMAGQAIREISLHRVERTEPGKELVHCVKARLVTLLESGMLSAEERAGAGDILADIGDPRFAFTIAGDLLVPDMAWCQVPAGPFLMGSSQGKDHDAFEDELPQHQVTLPAYQVGKYPVTNAQYRHFIEGGGYHEPQFWTESGWAWRTQHKIESPEYWDDPKWNSPNHPIVGVSWHEAVAFSRWLTMHLREAKLLPEQMTIRLLTEAEWEKAARGSDGRLYPWGDEWDPERANTRESGFGQTTAVGIYPAGASPCGCLDMSGNVWEWTLSKGQRYPYRPDDGREDMLAEGKRIIRGGSWALPRIQARASFREMADPGTRNHMIGFRVALCHIS